MRNRTSRPGATVSAVAPGLGLTLLTLGAATGLFLTVSLVSAPAADAHNVLVSSSPEDGGTVTEQPGVVELTFDQAVQSDFGQVVVLDADEAPQQIGEPRVVGGTVTQPVGDLADGDYTVSYRVISADGHPVSGTYTFTVALAASGESPPDGTASTPSEPLEPSEPPGPTASSTSSSASEPGGTESTSAPGEASEEASGGMSAGTIALVVGGALAVVALAFVAGGGRRRGAGADRSPGDGPGEGDAPDDGPQEDTEQR